MFRREKLFFAVACALVMAGVFCLIWAVKQQSALGGKPVTFNMMRDVPSVDIAQLTDEAAFQAEVLAIFVREFTNFPADHGNTNEPRAVTNFYAVEFRHPDGQVRSLSGRNVTSGQIDLVKRLEKGKVYTFPDVLLK